MLLAAAGLGDVTVIVDADVLVRFLGLACFGAARAAVDLFVTGVMAQIGHLKSCQPAVNKII